MTTKNLNSYTDEELEEEIERRERAHRNRLEQKPKPLVNPDFSQLIEICKDHINRIFEDDTYYDRDMDNYIVDEVFSCIFGPSVWIWIHNNYDQQ